MDDFSFKGNPINFYPRPPRGGRPFDTIARATYGDISIHALREEGDMELSRRVSEAYKYFYPRPPRGGRHDGDGFAWALQDISIHALREEGDFDRGDRHRSGRTISIHALREEGDRARDLERNSDMIFLSTPSARRATGRTARGLAAVHISIHALREEGDDRGGNFVSFWAISIHALREEGDYVDSLSVDAKRISIHALREEGDRYL